MPRGRSGERWGRVGVRCFGRVWVLRDVPASTWMEAAVSTDMAGIFPGLVESDDAAELYSLWSSEADMATRCTRVSQRALGRAAGREWHFALNLVKEVQGSWTHLNGLLVREGVRSDRVSLADYLDAAYTVFQEKLDKDNLKAFDARLRKMPSGAGTLYSKPAMSTRDQLLAFAKD